MLYNQNKSCVKSCQKHCLKKHCFQKNALFSNMCTFLSHCFETKNYHWTMTLKLSSGIAHDKKVQIVNCRFTVISLY